MFENTTYNPGPLLIRDRRLLYNMARKGHFEYPIHKRQLYVDEKHHPRRFEYKGNKFEIRYLDGCFYPFVFLEKAPEGARCDKN